MAKLSARGRKEIARFSKEKFISNNELIDWERVLDINIPMDGRMKVKLS